MSEITNILVADDVKLTCDVALQDGMSVAAEIIKAHAGSLEVTSTPGQGSIFNVIVPVRE
jgi:K+-sensing histidine kinase KdpD